MKTLIKNGLIYDGKGKTPYKADIFIENDIIAEIKPSDGEGQAYNSDLVIDAKSKAVTPGFIDTHRHCDIAVINDPAFAKLELSQGITTAIGGNCGLAPVPVSHKSKLQTADFIEPCLGRAKNNMEYRSFKEYLNAVENANPKINTGFLIGAGTLRAAIKGYGSGNFSKEEMNMAQGYIADAMQAGAFGLSMGIMYIPECFSSTDEMITLAKTAGKHNGVLSCHIRGEGDSLVESVQEVIKISKKAEIPLNISHFKSTGLSNFNSNIHRAIELVEKARLDKQDVTVDFYPYTYGATTMMSLLPPQFMKKTVNETLISLGDKTVRAKLKQELSAKHEGWDNMVEAIGFERIIISSVTKENNKQFVSKDVAQATSEIGFKDCVEFICDLMIEENGKVGIIVMSMAQEDVDTVAKLPYSFLISDSLYTNTDMPHPRLNGSYGRFINDYVLKRNVVDIQTAIKKMTLLPALRYGINDRGRIEVGKIADINIFNPTVFKDNATFTNSKAICTGMDMVLINGAIAFDSENVNAPKKSLVFRKQV